MIQLKQYCTLKGIERTTAWRRVQRGELLQVPQGKEVYIIDEELERRPQKDSKEYNEIVRLKKEEWNALILNASIPSKETGKINKAVRKETIRCITEELKYYNAKGYEFTGYDEKSLYRKINAGRVERKVRDKAGTYKNEIVVRTLEDKLMPLASYIYLKNADKNIYLTADLIKAYAEKHETHYELAAIPRPTMIRVLTKEISSRGIKEIHTYMNHFNEWNKSRVYVTGAFTDDMEYMDYIIGDDHKCDIYKVLNWNELRNAFENKTLFTWFWLEAKTQKVLSCVIKTTEINSDDLKRSLIEAMTVAGRPNKAILVDNGIGRSAEFMNCCNKMRVPVSFSKPYHPTEKATGERIFGYVKKEHDVFFNNYTGSRHEKEGRHEGLSLTPAQADFTFEDFRSSLLLYISGFYETRIREKTINGKRTKISIKQYWEESWKNFSADYPSEEELATAYMSEAEGVFDGKILFQKEWYMPNTYHGVACNGMKFRIHYNPLNMSTIYLYATKHFMDKTTGAEYFPGKLVMECSQIRSLDVTVKREKVGRINKDRKKNVKELADTYIDAALTNNPNLIEKINSTVGDNGNMRNIRSIAHSKVKQLIENSVPEQDISRIIEQEAKQGKFELSDLLADDVFMKDGETTLNEKIDEDAMLNELNNLKF